MDDVYEFLKKAGVYYLATTDGDQPRVRPFGTVNIFEGKLYIQTGKVKPCAQQLLANPKFEICAMSEGSWIRVWGELIEDDRPEAQQSMLDAYPNLGEMYKVGDGNTLVLYVKDGHAKIEGFGTEPKECSF